VQSFPTHSLTNQLTNPTHSLFSLINSCLFQSLSIFERCFLENIAMSESPPKYQIKSRIWITTEDGTFLGEGRIALLKQIDQHGSISVAAKEMGMSYKKAWRLIDSMNKLGTEILVERTIGGKGGGGTKLSDAGRKAIELFTELQQGNYEYLDTKMNQIDFL
jgi:molybdate transport system regulatory protein